MANKRSYFKVVPGMPSTAHLFFFDAVDRDSIDVAYREALEFAARAQLEPDRISVWQMPGERGPWTPGRINRGVAVVGENRHQRTLH